MQVTAHNCCSVSGVGGGGDIGAGKMGELEAEGDGFLGRVCSCSASERRKEKLLQCIRAYVV